MVGVKTKHFGMMSEEMTLDCTAAVDIRYMHISAFVRLLTYKDNRPGKSDFKTSRGMMIAVD